MAKKGIGIVVLACGLVALGFLLPAWPLEVAGIVLAAWRGREIPAICLGLLCDIAYTNPTGLLQYLVFPFTVLAVGACIAYRAAELHIVQKTPQGRI